MTGNIFIDAHVHIHDCFDLAVFFDAAIANFKQVSRDAGRDRDSSRYVLLLCESSGKNYFSQIRRLADRESTLSNPDDLTWRFARASAEIVVQADRSDGGRLFLVAGRQLITAERLEVLALMTAAAFEEGLSLSETVRAVHDAGGLAVVPWGVGKWIGKRGAILKHFLATADRAVHLGDNGGRPVFWPTPSLFAACTATGGRVLAGTDPLPLPAEVQRVGRFGTIMNARWSSQIDADLKQAFVDPAVTATRYGSLEKTARFLKNQFTIRFRHVC